MSITFRHAKRADVAAVVAMLRDDPLGSGREAADISTYLAAYDAMAREASNHLIVGLQGQRIVATYQITFISGLSLAASRRAQIESVRVAADLRGQKIGEQLMQDAENRARVAGCKLLQLTSNASRDRARAFYERLGFTPSHVGYKRVLD
ncbi:MAG: GNAT family N-acetyltransferase [Marinosulfonomonas sp.]|nr:GNAT family N-acetyltransferase [Marinosulfonomonas sp.]